MRSRSTCRLRQPFISTLALVAGAFSVACAIFLILELDHPFGGMIRIPNEAMTNVLSQLVTIRLPNDKSVRLRVIIQPIEVAA